MRSASRVSYPLAGRCEVLSGCRDSYRLVCSAERAHASGRSSHLAGMPAALRVHSSGRSHHLAGMCLQC